MPGDSTEYERGLAAGSVLARLDSHDQHLSKINGSMDRVADELGSLKDLHQDLLRAIQRLGDAAEADRSTVVTTAAALKDADAARRDQGERRWTPIQRLIAVVVALAAVASVITGLLVWLSQGRGS